MDHLNFRRHTDPFLFFNTTFFSFFSFLVSMANPVQLYITAYYYSRFHSFSIFCYYFHPLPLILIYLPSLWNEHVYRIICYHTIYNYLYWPCLWPCCLSFLFFSFLFLFFCFTPHHTYQEKYDPSMSSHMIITSDQMLIHMQETRKRNNMVADKEVHNPRKENTSDRE